MKYRTEIDDSIFENWPDVFYELDPDTRKQALIRHRELVPEDPEDQRRLEILESRYMNGKDRYFLAWVMLKVASREPVTFFNRRKHEADILENLLIFGIDHPDDCQRKEWEAFAKEMIHSFADSASFRTVIFGMGSANDRTVAFRIAHEIQDVTEKAPSSLNLREKVLPFAQVLKEQFIRFVPEGEEILQEIQFK